MKLTWVVSTAIKKGYRFVKTRMTAGIIENSYTAMPFGFDSNPSKNFIAIVGETQSNDKPVIIGYLNPRALEDIKTGESMQYSTDEEGNIKASLIMRKNGTCEIIGSSDNAIRYTPLDSELKKYNTSIQAELVKIAAGITAAGGAYSPGTLSIDISESKIDEIKVN